MPDMPHPLRPTKWSVVLAPDGYPSQVDEFACAEANPSPAPLLHGQPWDAGQYGYTDPHEFDRRAVAAYLSPADTALVAEWCRVAEEGNFNVDFVGGARSMLIREWEGMGSPVYPDRHGHYTVEMLRANENSRLGGKYLHCRGFKLRTICVLRQHLSALVAAAGLGNGRLKPSADPSRPDDDLDRVLYTLTAGLSANEIGAALTTGAWPDVQALTLMAGLRA